MVVPTAIMAESRAFAERAATLLQHRGPDGEGYWSGASREVTVSFGHRRLAILDPSKEASQPMTTHGLTVVLNGEIYNHVELRRELETKGYRFRTRSDTEVLLAAYAHWGAECLAHLSGMFAFAIADLGRQEVFLARDPFGIKPLFYTSMPSAFAFASEPGPLIAYLPRRRINGNRLEEYLRVGTADGGGDSFFEGIWQLPQAHFLRIALTKWPLQEPEPERYWRLSAVSANKISLDDAVEQFRNLFLDSVRLHLRSDVPIAIATSGGVDSSSILAGVRHSLGKDASIRAICYEASEKDISDAQWAKIAMDATRAEPNFFRISTADVQEDLRNVVAAQNEPFVNPAVYAQYRLFRECASMGSKVLLEGQGADEMLGGYSYFVASRVASMLRQGHFVDAARLLAKRPFHDIRSAIGELRANGSRLGETPFRAALRRAQEESTLPSFLRWGDRNAMAWSIENRVPFLSTQLAEFVYSLPEEFLISNERITKFILRRAMKGLVPEAILSRRDKIGFGTPYIAWLEAMRPELARLIAIGNHWLGVPAIRSIISQAQPFLSGSPVAPGLARRLWGLLTLLLWTDVFQVSPELDTEVTYPVREKNSSP